MTDPLTPAPADFASLVDHIRVVDLLVDLLKRDPDTDFALHAGQLRWQIEAPDDRGLVPVVVLRKADDGLVARVVWHWSALVVAD